MSQTNAVAAGEATEELDARTTSHTTSMVGRDIETSGGQKGRKERKGRKGRPREVWFLFDPIEGATPMVRWSSIEVNFLEMNLPKKKKSYQSPGGTEQLGPAADVSVRR